MTTITAAPQRAASSGRGGGLRLRHPVVMLVTAAWALGVLLPIAALIGISFLKSRGISVVWEISFGTYADILGGFRLEVILRTLRIVATVTLIELLLAFPFALWLAKGMRDGWAKTVTLVLLVVPFFLSPAARTIVWRSILGREGLINTVLTGAGVVDQPLDWLLFSEFAIHLGLIGPYFPSMVWPLFISIALIDDELIKASRDLGASEWETLRHVILPLAMPGIAAGVIFTAVPMLGDNVVSTLLGGGQVSLIAEGFNDLVRAMNFTGAAAMASVVLFVIVGLGLAAHLLLRRRVSIGQVFSEMRS